MAFLKNGRMGKALIIRSATVSMVGVAVYSTTTKVPRLHDLMFEVTEVCAGTGVAPGYGRGRQEEATVATKAVGMAN